MSRLTKSRDAKGYENRIEYDFLGNKTKVIDSENRQIEYEYDKLNRLSEVKNEYYSTFYQYDALGNKTKEIDGEVNSQRWVYDNNNRVKVIEDAKGYQTVYTYDKLDNVTSIRDKAGNITRYEYDDNYRKTKEIVRGGAQIQYEYDDVGNLIRTTDEEKIVTEYEYNPRYELTNVIKPEGNVKYKYDSEGNVTEVEDLVGTEKYYYDSLNRLIEKEIKYTKVSTNANLQKGYKIQNEYDINGNISKLKLPSGVGIEYKYNKNNWLTEVTALGKTIAVYNYDNSGKNTETLYGNDTKNTYRYDNIGRLSELEIMGKFKDSGSPAEGIFFNDYYEYDMANNRTKKIGLDEETTKYSYDKNSQITGIDYNFAGTVQYDQTYTYDSMGNRLHMKYKYGEIDYDYNSINYELKKYAINKQGITKYEYDARGNTIRKINLTGNQKNNEFEYTFDSENRLIKVWHKNHILAKKLKNSTTQNTSITEMEYYYNSSGMRIGVKEPSQTNVIPDPSSVIPEKSGIQGIQYYIYSGNNVLAELNDKGEITSEFIYGLEKTARIDHPKPLAANSFNHADNGNPVKLVYFHNDTIGSAAILTSDTGYLLQEYHYDPFGSIVFARGKDGNKYRFAGKEYDRETGLSYFGARFYDPLTGRFISKDPISDDFSPVTHNPYPYAANNPYKYVDPNGEFLLLIAGIAAVAGGAYAGSEGFTDFENFNWEKAFAGAALSFTAVYGFGSAFTATGFLGAQGAIATGQGLASGTLGFCGSGVHLASTIAQIGSGEGLTLGAGLSALATFGTSYLFSSALEGYKGWERVGAQMLTSLVSTTIGLTFRIALGDDITTDEILSTYGMALATTAIFAGIEAAESTPSLPKTTETEKPLDDSTVKAGDNNVTTKSSQEIEKNLKKPTEHNIIQQRKELAEKYVDQGIFGESKDGVNYTIDKGFTSPNGKKIPEGATYKITTDRFIEPSEGKSLFHNLKKVWKTTEPGYIPV